MSKVPILHVMAKMVGWRTAHDVTYDLAPSFGPLGTGDAVDCVLSPFQFFPRSSNIRLRQTHLPNAARLLSERNWLFSIDPPSETGSFQKQ
jgi:hypothetical protein